MKDELHPDLDALELRCLTLAASGRTREGITRETDITQERVDEAFIPPCANCRPTTLPKRFFAPHAWT